MGGPTAGGMVHACVAMLLTNPKEHAHDKRGNGIYEAAYVKPPVQGI